MLSIILYKHLDKNNTYNKHNLKWFYYIKLKIHIIILIIIHLS